MSLAIITHPDCLLHDAGLGHPEKPERVQVISDALSAYPFKKPVQFLQAELASRDQLVRAHDASYVDWIFSIAPKKEMVVIDADTAMNPYTLNAALRAAGSVIQAVDLVMKRDVQAVFCNVRPPGHHAEKDKAMGFCFFNNVAVGVMHALDVYKLERIAIIDFDVHHGNGTQNIFQHDKRVMYCSSFEYPFYPGYDEEMDNKHILSVPLAAGTSSQDFREKVKQAWFQKLMDFNPQLIFFSAGFDAHRDDPLADLNLVKEDYVWITTEIAKIAEQCCGGKMISVLEGGYELHALADSVPAHVEAMLR